MNGTVPARSPWPLLLLLMAIGLAARLVNSASGLWFDEIVTLVTYVRAPLREVLTKAADLNNHVLFTLAAKASVGAFGESAWALRLPAVLFGVAAIPALWWFASRVVDRREALFAAVLLTVSHQAVWFSQNARGYTGLLFWNLVGSALFLEGLRRPVARTWVAYGLVSAASIWTHLTAAFMVAAHGIVWLVLLILRKRPGIAASRPGVATRWPLIGFLVAAVVGFLLYAALLPELLHQFGKQAGLASENVKVREWTSPLWTIREAIRQTGLGPAGLIGLAVAGILAITGFVSVARRDAVAAAIMVLPAPVALALMLALGFHIWPRYFFPLFGFALVFFVRGVWVAARVLAGRAQAQIATALLCVVAAVSAFTLPSVWRLPKQDYEGAREFVAANRAPGEPVVTVGLASFAYDRFYEKDWTSVDDVAALDRVMGAGPRTWLVYSFPTVLRTSHPEVFDRITTRYDVVREFPGSVGDGTVFVARSR